MAPRAPRRFIALGVFPCDDDVPEQGAPRSVALAIDPALHARIAAARAHRTGGGPRHTPVDVPFEPARAHWSSLSRADLISTLTAHATLPPPHESAPGARHTPQRLLVTGERMRLESGPIDNPAFESADLSHDDLERALGARLPTRQRRARTHPPAPDPARSSTHGAYAPAGPDP